MSNVVSTIVQKVFEYDWVLPNYAIPVYGRVEAVRAANKLRSLGYVVRINSTTHLCLLYVSRQ